MDKKLRDLIARTTISRQFEFLQNAWHMNTKFSGLTNESDALLGNRGSCPRLPGHGPFHSRHPRSATPPDIGPAAIRDCPRRRIFFLPGLRALRYFAGTDSR